MWMQANKIVVDNIEGDCNEAIVSGGLAKQAALLDPDHLLRTAPQPFEVVVRAHLQREEVYQHPAAAVDQDPAVVAVAFGARAPAIDAHREVDGVHDRPPLANVVDGRHDEVIGERGEARQVEQDDILGLPVDEDIQQLPGTRQRLDEIRRPRLRELVRGVEVAEVVEVVEGVEIGVIDVGRGNTGLQAAPPAAGACWRPSHLVYRPPSGTLLFPPHLVPRRSSITNSRWPMSHSPPTSDSGPPPGGQNAGS